MTRKLSVTTITMILLATSLVAWPSIAAAQEDAAEAALEGAAADPVASPKRMQVVGENIRVRSGPGLYFYELTQLSEPAVVEVVGDESGWSAIRPPAGVQAIVKKSDVQAGDEGSGLVLTDAARVYAVDPAPGSERTWAVIAILQRDGIVKITGERGEYHIVGLPAKAKVYVKSSLLGEVTESSGGGITIDIGEVEPLKIDPAAKTYDKAIELFNAELKKPLLERRWAEIEGLLAEISEQATAAYLKNSAAQIMQTIDLQKYLQKGMASVEASSRAQTQLLEAIRQERLDKEATQLRVDSEETPPAWDFEGTLKEMVAVMTFKYRLEDSSGRYVCLLSGDQAMLAPHLGKRVRVWGEKQYRADFKKYVVDVRGIELVVADEADE